MYVYEQLLDPVDSTIVYRATTLANVVGVGDSSPTNGPVVQRLARPSGMRETRGSIPGLAFSFLLHKCKSREATYI